MIELPIMVNILKFSDFLFFKKKCWFRAGIHKMQVRITNREDPDQTASSGSALVANWCLKF